LKKLNEKAGIAVGMIAAIFLFFPVFRVLMGDCFFEQGCGEYEGIKLFVAFLTSCIIGYCVGWSTIRLIRLLNKFGDP